MKLGKYYKMTGDELLYYQVFINERNKSNIHYYRSIKKKNVNIDINIFFCKDNVLYS